MVRKLGVAVGALVGAVAFFAVGWWAGRTALEPPADPLAQPAPVSIAVVDGTVGRALQLSATAGWDVLSVVRAPVSGVVTSVDFDAATPVSENSRLATVNLEPTFAAVGNVPAFRDLAVGAKGADVGQLEAFLARVGHDPGLQDASFSNATAQAVRAWQTAVGAPVTGTVRLGALVFMPSLPALARPVVLVGQSVGAGEPLLEVVAAAPVFRMGVTDEQISLLPPAAAVRVTGGGAEWAAQAGRIETVEGNPVLVLDGVDGQPVCALSCAAVPLIGESSWQAVVTVVPEATGAVVPVGAVRTGPDGSRFVVMDDGAERPVDVLASSDGQAVVTGVATGDRVLLPEPT